MLFAVRLVDLSAIKALDLTGASNAEIAERLRQVFDFLPKETKIEVTDGIVTIDIPDSAIQDKSEADRLHIRATQRAKQGDYRKAVGIWERVIELDPANVEARRNLGMAYVELQETDKARENLVEAAVLDPKDAWSFVVLGNILAKADELEGAERFFKQALELKPEDGWAMNSLGANFSIQPVSRFRARPPRFGGRSLPGIHGKASVSDDRWRVVSRRPGYSSTPSLCNDPWRHRQPASSRPSQFTPIPTFPHQGGRRNCSNRELEYLREIVCAPHRPRIGRDRTDAVARAVRHPGDVRRLKTD